MIPGLSIELSAVIVAVTDESPRVLVVPGDDGDALPAGPFDVENDRTIELALRRWVSERAQLELGYVEQLYTFGDRFRTGDEAGEPRAISIGYLALTREASTPRAALSASATWRDWYEYFPWEDRRNGSPAMVEAQILPAIAEWVESAQDPAQRESRAERVAAGFPAEAVWDDEFVLQRFELMYETGLTGLGRPMAFDHRRILATAIGRLRGKIKYRPLVFELLLPEFTFSRLQRTVEALAGVRLHTGNFRRLVESAGLVEPTGRYERRARGRPAELFRYRREVLRERPVPGVMQPFRQRAR